ncbi:MAG TPA: hypothetical protein VNU49_05045 [Opitutaceae bacterium]|jgi:hypothetical protein|nr:hypothetical protein [Opitutaceae bacterium]
MERNIPLLGLHKRQLDAYRRLCLPAAWSTDSARVWFLFPRDIMPPCNPVFRSLYLLPVDGSSPRNIIATSPTRIMGTPTPELALDVLRSHARRHTLDPKVATVIRTTPSTSRFTLTLAQLDWLGCRGRTLLVLGTLNIAWIYTPAGWAKLNDKTDRNLHDGQDLDVPTYLRKGINFSCEMVDSE